jgi:transcriptional regulator with XRE-family HTH domain
MAKLTFSFTKEMADFLKKRRKQAGLSQTDVAKVIGLSVKSGDSFISRLEQGKIENPFLRTIILYLDACHIPYNALFSKMSELRFKEHHQEIMSHAMMIKDRIKDKNIIKKIDRDTALYAEKIKFQRKTPYLDKDKLKAKISREVSKFLSDHQVDKNLYPTYIDFAYSIIPRVQSAKPNPKINYSSWLKPDIRPELLHHINLMIYKIIHKEENKLNRRKIPSTDKQKKMAIGFLKYREMIEQVEAEVHQLLNDLQVPLSLYTGYKDFARECFSHLRKLYFKDQLLLSQRFAQSIRGWREAKLDENVLNQVKEITIKEFKDLVIKSAQK